MVAVRPNVSLSYNINAFYCNFRIDQLLHFKFYEFPSVILRVDKLLNYFVYNVFPQVTLFQPFSMGSSTFLGWFVSLQVL